MNKTNEPNLNIEQILYKSLFENHKMPKERIRKVRKQYSMTQINFSDLIMVNYETYRSWEEGRRFPSSPGVAILFIAEKHPKIFLDYRKELISKLKLKN